MVKYYLLKQHNREITEIPKPTNFEQIQKFVDGNFEVKNFKIANSKGKKISCDVYINEDRYNTPDLIPNHWLNKWIHKHKENYKFFTGDSDLVNGKFINLGCPTIYGNVIIKVNGKSKLDEWKVYEI